MKLTLKETGKLLGTDERSIINWEKGRTEPKVYRLPSIIRFLGYNLLPKPHTIAERLVAKRLEHGWSRKVASRHLEIEVPTLRDWEHGKIILFRKHRRLVAEALGIAESELDAEMKARWTAVRRKTGQGVRGYFNVGCKISIDIDYFENSRRATYVQRSYAIDNPLKFEGYCHCLWGITASDGPGPVTLKVNGIEREFFDYVARGVPFGPDDGTIAPWAVVASLPFAPEIVLRAIEHCIHELKLTLLHPYGFKATFNPTFPEKSGSPYGWVSPWHYGLNQGPIILMIENYRSGLLWQLMRQCPYIASGLRRAGFDGGWL